jgi:NAD(P)-dependent dehydrogenase (short-subunit alcohol dehydrogenase family)
LKKVAIVTGASRGIGLATVVALAREEYDTIAVVKKMENSQQITSIANELGNITIIKADISDKNEIDQLFLEIKNKFGRIDVLVNNAGFMAFGALEDMSEEVFRSQLETDFFAPVFIMKRAIPIMLSQEEDVNGIKAHIINISSIAGKIPFAFSSAYTASKFALEGMSEAVSDEIESLGIRVRLVEPGVVKTDFFKNCQKFISENSRYFEMTSIWDKTADKLFEKAMTMPEDVANSVLDIIKNPHSNFRNPVGQDAKLFLDTYSQYQENPQKFKVWFAEQMEELFKVL